MFSPILVTKKGIHGQTLHIAYVDLASGHCLCIADGRLKGPVNHGETNPNSFVMVMSSIELAQFIL